MSKPEVFVRQVMSTTRNSEIPLMGENSTRWYGDISLEQIVKNSKLYMDGMPKKSLSFNFVRMDKNMFEPDNWSCFVRFVKRMLDASTFQAKLGLGGRDSLRSSDVVLGVEEVQTYEHREII
ncbi:beta-amylase 1, chloroplastic-like [Magnolia sinica]|uniref:beta-amylase 1, chloroplastic-like n=1 Tax=Magnolia sinica TaxID=86752 RepID=UPI0026597A04|nr:beta-amylase 1, chloroplastic-like [Magnolia sinica]